MENQQSVADYILSELTALFPNSGIVSHVRTIIGEPNIWVRYTNAKSVEQCNSNIWENDPAYMSFMIDYRGDRSWIMAPTMHSLTLRRNGVKFRKINAKSQKEAAEKLIAWLAKNKDAILAVGLRNEY